MTIRQASITIQLIATSFVLHFSSLYAAEIDTPKPLDDRLKVELFASEPDVVTVTGLTVDAKGRVLVVESHTHFRPDDYDGPETDRIRLLEDTTGDGKADRVETFFSGTKSTMNVAAHPNGWVYVATRDSVFRIRDRDDDGKSDQHQMLVQLETTSDYPHNGLSGFAFDFSGNVYFGFGENMGQDATLTAGPGHVYFTLGQNFAEDAELIGNDGVRLVSRRGSGGVYRMREDGRELQRMATGFWNPFHLCFDAFGRMFLGDNDPGNRPPCRFLSIVEGGDYGYRRRTLEPFIAINAEVPGTLPMTSSTGESPTGILAYESNLLPAEYRGSILVATWGEHRIDRYQLKRDGAGFTVKTEPMVAGGEHFRPAGIAVAPDGSLYVGDWADRSYPLHGKGRVWHITMKDTQSGNATNRSAKIQMDRLRSADLPTREDAARKLLAAGDTGKSQLAAAMQDDANARVRSIALTALTSAGAITQALADRALADPNEAVREQAARTLPNQWIDLTNIVSNDTAPAVQAAALRRIADAGAETLILKTLGSDDAFLRQAATLALGQSVDTKRLLQLTSHDKAPVRLAAVLLLRGGPNENGPWTKLANSDVDEILTSGIHDPDPQVRFAIVEWIGREELKRFRQPLANALAERATTPQLFEAWLAALAQLDGVMERWTKSSVGDWWAKKAPQRYVSQLLDDSRTSPAVLRQVLLYLPQDHAALTFEKLRSLIQSQDQPLRLEATRVLASNESAEARALLVEIASDNDQPVDLRAEAIMGLNPTASDEFDILMKLVSDVEPAIRHEALRTLRGAQLNDQQRSKLLSLADDAMTIELVQRILDPVKTHSRPDAENLSEWIRLLDGPADAAAGQRVFFHPRGPGCSRCHRIDGRGTAVGPSFVRMNGRLSLTRERLIETILQPSKEIDPGYLPVSILTVDGRIASGIYHKHNGKVRSVIDSNGKVQSFKLEDIEEIFPSKNSIMPDGLATAMTLQEFRDLIAFLSFQQ
ncbi:PVC-type heme-binding CxxCH protein [Novipirellula sp. SH528]|uniref:PVC-type heme-binding CxxCH protein n=1 Tax=Novipirellula sp. SH528 TaxID=3454466 RepID=UPI003F9F9AED